ncbi:MAG TPA: hypothetical protein DCM62_02410 [Bacteroidales bacterium]|nr:hypothetical protein [Bacteroidales bacterium]
MGKNFTSILSKLGVEVWVLCEDIQFLKEIEASIARIGCDFRMFNSADNLKNTFFGEASKPKLLLIDYPLGDNNGLQVIQDLNAKDLFPAFIAMIAPENENHGLLSLKSGAKNYVIKGKDFNERLPLILQSAIIQIESNLKLGDKVEALEKKQKSLKEQKKKLKAQSLALLAEKKKVEELLGQMLPKTIAKELLQSGTVKLRYFPSVTVLFADIENFSLVVSRFTPLELVKKLETYYNAFEAITKNFGLEKIKTIGDCYMCAGGIPVEDKMSAARVVLAGLHFGKVSEKLKTLTHDYNDNFFSWRIGVHTGGAVAGIIGKDKLSYDVWGDTVNKAHWMEQVSCEGQVNISQECFELVGHFFDCTKRENHITTSHGKFDMYFANRLKPAYSSDAKGLFPNSAFCKSTGLSDRDNFYLDNALLVCD